MDTRNDDHTATASAGGRLTGRVRSSAAAFALAALLTGLGAHALPVGAADCSDYANIDVDTDGDGLTCYEEVAYHGTDGDNPDTDGDGVLDGDEIYSFGTDPALGDTDGDGYGDATEVFGCKGGFPSNPLDPASWPVCGLN